MPAPAPIYVERLAIRPRWWAITLLIALVGSSELFAGFALPVIAVVVPAVLLPTLVLLALASRTVLRVDSVGVHVGKSSMPYDEMESVEGLDGPRTRLLLGPQADPAARLFVRGFIRESVVVRAMRSEPVPYWLISTRHPDRVIAAVEQAARASRVQ
jgi:hypothetical protein